MAVKDIDRGWNKLKRKLKDVDGGFTKVGLPLNVDVQSGTRKGSKRKPITSSSELIQIASFNEFGTKNIPARPAMKQAFDSNRRAIQSFIDRIIMSNKFSTLRTLGLIGEFAAAKVKRQITKLRTPPNKPGTIKGKGSSNPLIDSGQYRASITHVESI